ncbi:MAG: hypothetical protein OIF35_10220 [Cellvibrionaceae bacterium]|nr:hypothetical protein [Cellvibrionaceae bacterium]
MNTGKFFLRIILAMIPCFGLWWFSGDWWQLPAVNITDWVMAGLFPDSYHSMQIQDSVVQLVTNWGEVQGRLVPARSAGYALAFEANMRILSYSIPFYFALQAALWDWQPKLRILISLSVLYLVMTVSLVFLGAKSLMVGLGGAFSEVNRFWYASPEAIALGYQLATLMLPVLVPVFMWVMTNQEKLLELFVKNKAAVAPAQASDGESEAQ